ncbi:MAG TPA: hypothetical protein ENG80_02165 [Nitrospirae bacterium]|nr:hypothetical protein BMS3Abin10_02258 [bacterium BMS3Abin10]GBE38510.1 hypothetical protein BMS3Bbin08_01117 [bacterium BMS3Bbin08]HDH00598.1 hypothetical protein [Nitrospirota bacterium]HDH50490.1 hypothetical protein [Nitrospirota bacterium]
MLKRGDESFLKDAFKKVSLVTATVIAGFFLSAVLVEWIKSSHAPFQGFANYEWVPRLNTFLYLMTMFNILVIRYAVMRIYIAPGPGPDDFKAVVRRLYRADIAAMLLSGLPCIYGLVLFLLAGDHVDFYLLFALTVIYGTIYFPRYTKWVSIVEEKEINIKAV